MEWRTPNGGDGLMVGVRIVRLIHEGETYTPLVDARGRMLSPEIVAHLATTPDPGAPARTLYLLLCDESTPRDGGGDPLDLGGFTWPDELPLTFSDSELPIGTIRSLCVLPPGTMEGAHGRHVVGIATLNGSILASVAFDAIKRNVLQGICALVEHTSAAEGRLTSGWFTGARLGDLESSCLSGARILEWQESK